MDDQQRARELLAAEYEKDAPESDIPKRLRDGSAPIMFWSDEVAIRAITAALRAAPEGFVLVPVELTDEMVEAFNRRDELPYPEKNRRAYKAIHCYAAMLAARPQGVKDAR